MNSDDHAREVYESRMREAELRIMALIETRLNEHSDGHDNIHRTLDELAKTLEAYTVDINAAQAESEEYKEHLRQVGREVLAFGERLTVLKDKLDQVIEDAQHTMRVLESRTELICARLDGHDLGFVTMGLDEDGRKKLAAMLRREHEPREIWSDWESSQGSCDEPIIPDEEGTSRR